MTGFIIAGVLLLFFVFLLAVPCHVVISADSEVRVWLRVLFVKWTLFPSKKRKSPKKEKQKREKQAAKKKRKKVKKEKKAEPPKKKRNILHMLRLILRLAAAVMKKLRRHLKIQLLAYEISVATGDAAKTAVLYGAVAGLSSSLFELLQSGIHFKVKKSAPVDVSADFLGEKTKARIKIDFSINLWGVLATLLAAGIAFVKNKNQSTVKS